MAIMDTLKAAQGGAAFAELGRAFGLDAASAEAVVAAVVPELTRKFERNTLSRGGLADVVQALGHGHHQAYLTTPALYRHAGAINDGNGILEHLVGGKDGSRGVADRAARETGVDGATIRAMLPVVAGMTMGGLSREVQGAFGDILGRMGLPVPDKRQMGGGSIGGRLGIPDVSRLPGGDSGSGLPMGDGVPQQRPRAMPQGGGSGGWGNDTGYGNDGYGDQQRQPPARGGWGGQRQGGGGMGGDVRSAPGGGLEMPDSLPPDLGGQNGGDQGYGRGQPQGRRGGGMSFPQGSGGDNPYGDLAEILRKGLGLPGGQGGPVIIRGPGSGGGGMPFPMPGGQGAGQGSSQGGGIQIPGGAVGGGLLWQIVRSLLGGALGGFQSKGIMGWIFKAVIMRYGWSILRGVLGRGLGR